MEKEIEVKVDYFRVIGKMLVGILCLMGACDLYFSGLHLFVSNILSFFGG